MTVRTGLELGPISTEVCAEKHGGLHENFRALGGPQQSHATVRLAGLLIQVAATVPSNPTCRLLLVPGHCKRITMLLYHEKQVAALCGVHCINTLLQGPYFSELDLAQIGYELDQLERQMLDDAAAGPSSNLDESGMFSVQVLAKALQIWGLTAIPTDNKELREAGFDPQQEAAFICNLQEHWFAIRKLNGEWYDFNSLYPAPEHLSAFYLTAYLDSLNEQGYTIFVVRGDLPAPPASSDGMDTEGPGKWWTPDEAQAAHHSAQESRQRGRAENAMEKALARAAAGGGSITLSPANRRQRSYGQVSDDDKDADLAAAIAASMQDHNGPAVGPAAADGQESYAAAARQAKSSQRTNTGSQQQGNWPAQDNDFMSYDDEDRGLAAALAASLKERQLQLLQQQQQDKQASQPTQELAAQQQLSQQQLPPVPDEPADGAEGSVTVAFRLPTGARLSRRFSKADTLGALQAFVAHELQQSGQMRPGQQVQLFSQFPRQLLDQDESELAAAGIEDRSMLSVQIS
eukprot:GHRR01012156.1.p1 GENE.GHRR01012156.1~~GHRR01012156.1.p1  ORF type:complete len:518 (+),score=186.72 GHRR01012156.1:322-1875(+)